MRETTLGELSVRMAGGTDREGGGSGPVVVLMHGFGAPGTDLVPLFRQIAVAPEVRFVFPEAPIALGPGYGEGRAWWKIDIARLQAAALGGEYETLVAEVPVGLAEARAKVSSLLDALGRDHDAPRSRVILGGFSQGAMLATDVVLRETGPLAGLVVLSGSVIAEREWLPLLARRAGLPVLQSHGRADPILPFELARRLHDHFTNAGLNASFLEWNGGHGIPNGVAEELGHFVSRVFSHSPR
jgi:phospholipase/carboxylesterase